MLRILAAVLVLGSCSSPPQKACVPGRAEACPCLGGATGFQACRPDGQSFGACQCGPVGGAAGGSAAGGSAAGGSAAGGSAAGGSAAGGSAAGGSAAGGSAAGGSAAGGAVGGGSVGGGSVGGGSVGGGSAGGNSGGGSSTGGGASGGASLPAWFQQAYVKASNTNRADEEFGYRVALSADGSTLAVSAVWEDGAATGVNGNQSNDCEVVVPASCALNSGAVYVFLRTGTAWTQEAYLKASNTGAHDRFGHSVALSGDGATLVVGAVDEDSNAVGINAPLSGTVLMASGTQANNSRTNSGAAYVFRKAGGVWAQEAYIKPSNPGANDRFGAEVTVSSDGSTMAVAAVLEDSNATGLNGNELSDSAADSGAVYVFRRMGSVWQQESYVKASNTNARDFFGTALTLSGDGAVLAVGAPSEASASSGINGNQADNSAAAAGAVYVFRRVAGVWAQEAYVKASNAEADDGFGVSAALDFDGTALVVGAVSEASDASGINGSQTNNSAVQSGAVYVFQRAGAWTQEAYVKASNTGVGDFFGIGVAVSNDGATMVVAACYEDSRATGINGDQADNSVLQSGALYRRTAGVWAQQAYVKASNTGDSDFLGGQSIPTLALSGDGTTFAAGSPGEDSNATGINGNQLDESVFGAGAAYVFTR